MKVAIIDIGTQSIKHYILEVEGSDRTTIFYKRYSDGHLGDNDEITQSATRRNIHVLRECLEKNKKENVEQLKLLGTDVLRKAKKSAGAFLAEVKNLTGQDIQVISQDLEASYLYEGFIPILPDDFHFAALNIGGGSTEAVIGDARRMETFINLSFGVKFLRSTFAHGEEIDWAKLDLYLDEKIIMKNEVKNVFITGALDFISAAGPALGVIFDTTVILHHPVSLSIERYEAYINMLRATSVAELKKLYPKDPGFCDNLAIGQSVYLVVAKKLAAKTIIPSRNDLTDGVIHRMLHEITDHKRR